MRRPTPAEVRFVDQFHDPMGCFLEYSEIFGAPAPLSQVEYWLRLAPLSYWIGLVSVLDRCLLWRPYDPATQLAMLDNVFTPSDAVVVRRALETEREFGRPILFHGHQLLYLLRLALTTEGVPAEPADGGFPEDVSIGRVLLAVAELLVDPKSGPPAIELPAAMNVDRLNDYWLRASQVQSRIYNPRTANVYWDLHVELPKRTARGGERTFRDHAQRLLGLPVEEFIAAGYGLLEGCIARGDPLKGEFKIAIRDPVAFLATTPIAEEHRKAFESLMVATPEQLAASARDIRGDVRRLYDFTWLERRPVVRVAHDRYVVPSRETLFFRISRGLYPTLHDLAQATGDRSAERSIKDRRADATEDFVRARLRVACGSDARSLADRKYGNGKEAGDAVVFDTATRTLIIAEVKSGQRERKRRTWGGGDELFAEGYDLPTALAQLGRVVADALLPERSGYPIARVTGDAPGALVHRPFTIIPLVVTDEPFCRNSFFRQRLDEEAAKVKLRPDMFVTPVGLVSFADLDLLATPSLVSRGIADLLTQWLRNETLRGVSLHEFLRRRGVDWAVVGAESGYSIVPRGAALVLRGEA